jgi:hypothetical protein
MTAGARHLRLVVIAAVLLVLASVSIDCGRGLRVVDTNGSPVRTVLIVYHHEGRRLSFHPQSYQASAPSILESVPPGRVQIPPSIHAHKPFPLEAHPKIIVDMVYAPSLHNGLATIRDTGIYTPGAFRVDDDLSTVTLSDLSGTPLQWQGTMMNVSSMISQLLIERSSGDSSNRPRPVTAELHRLIQLFTADYEAFLVRYGDVARPRPEVPAVVRFGSPADRPAWEKMVDTDLAGEPHWGDVARRLFAREVERFSKER